MLQVSEDLISLATLFTNRYTLSAHKGSNRLYDCPGTSSPASSPSISFKIKLKCQKSRVARYLSSQKGFPTRTERPRRWSEGARPRRFRVWVRNRRRRCDKSWSFKVSIKSKWRHQDRAGNSSPTRKPRNKQIISTNRRIWCFVRFAYRCTRQAPEA